MKICEVCRENICKEGEIICTPCQENGWSKQGNSYVHTFPDTEKN